MPRAGPAGPCPAPCAGAVGPPCEGPGGGPPQEGTLREGPAHGAGHGSAGPAVRGMGQAAPAWYGEPPIRGWPIRGWPIDIVSVTNRVQNRAHAKNQPRFYV